MAIFKVNPASGIDELMTRSLIDLRELGSLEVNNRTSSKTLEILKYTISSTNPVDRIIRNPERKNNLIAQIAETAWVLSGSRNLKYLSPFLPRAIDYSDDLETWRAGYGRISSLTYTPPEGFFVSDFEGDSEGFFSQSETLESTLDQISNVVNILTEDPSSRQAFIVIALPGDNLVSNKTKDTPCTLNIQFIIREGELHCFVFMRSNDAIWGLTGINYFEWTFLQEILASILGVKVGTYDHTAGSFHVYERHFKTVDKILNSSSNVSKFDPSKHIPLNVKSLKELNTALKKYLNTIDTILNPEKGNRESIQEIERFLSTGNNLNIYFSLPLIHLIYTHRGVDFNSLSHLFLNFESNSYLWRGVLKSSKFFMNGIFIDNRN